MKKIWWIVFLLVVVIAAVLWFSYRSKQNKSEAEIPVLSVSAFNQNLNNDAISKPARPDDEIIYTLTAENQGQNRISGFVFEVGISDIADKATLVDASGASFNSGTNSLVWTPLDIEADQSIQKTFKVRVNRTSGNQAMKVKFNNEVTVNLAKSEIAGVNTNAETPPVNDYHAPTTGVNEYLPLFFAIISTISIFFVRKWKTGVA